MAVGRPLVLGPASLSELIDTLAVVVVGAADEDREPDEPLEDDDPPEVNGDDDLGYR